MIYIIRHGQTDLNNRKVLQGHSNFPLNEKGIEQAREVSKAMEEIHFEKIYSSPLTRAIQTAKIISPDRNIVVDDRLIEMDYGPYEGMDLTHPAPEVMTFFKDFIHNPAPKGMEPLDSVVKRAGMFLEELCRSDTNILVSTHAIAMKGLLEYLTPESNGSYWSKYIGNCEVYCTEYKDGCFTIPKPMR
ncbi:MAG: histidine phosphatase family protein [Faecalicoccus sp.]|nr:histidine phosphatase family protein [Faecalicoccus sp.]